MAGPGEGKVPVQARVLVRAGASWRPVSCTVYVHLKGYSQARVTHLDIEADELNELLLPPGGRGYATASVAGEQLVVSLRGPKRAVLLLASPELGEVLGRMKSVVYVGGKQGGVFIGFRREYIGRLEEYARKKLHLL